MVTRYVERDADGNITGMWESPQLRRPHLEPIDSEDPELLAYLGPNLERERMQALERIDLEAEAARLRYITPGTGQALEYQRAEAEADAYRSAGYPADTTPYPMVQAEADAARATAKDAADTILARRDQWVRVGAAIRRERRKGKIAVRVAADAAEVQTARENAIAALSALF